MTTPAPEPNSDVSVDIWPHPLTAEGRTLKVIPVIPGADTVEAVAAAIKIRPSLPLFAILNGTRLDPALWHSTRITPGDILQFRAAVHGGDDNSNPLAIVLFIALTYFTYGTGSGTLSSLAPNLSGGALAATQAAVFVVGSLAINAIAPPRLPDAPDAPGAADSVYSLTGGANRARRNEPIMLVIGRHRVFPDLGAAEHTRLVGRDQYLSQIFDFGFGDLEVADLRIGETALDDYLNVESQWSNSSNGYEPQTLFAGNVDVIGGGNLVGPDSPVTRTTSDNTTHVYVDIVGALGDYNRKNGNEVRACESIEITYSRPLIAPTTRTIKICSKPRTPVRRTYKLALPYGAEWDISVRRLRPPTDSGRRTDRLTFSQMACHQPDTGDYTGRTRLALDIRASGQINGRVSQLSAIASQRVPVWADGAWGETAEPSSNPAALLRWFARGIFVSEKKVAGVGLAANRIDDSALGAWFERCATLGLECNFLLTSLISHSEVINTICQAGDAAPTWSSGRLGVIYADQADPPVAMFTPGNILSGTMAVNYANSAPPSAIAVRYVAPENDWQLTTVRRPVPAADTTGQIATVTLRGVTRRAQAIREANQIAARQKFHRRTYSFEVALEGLAVARGDVVFIANDMVSGGDSARLMAAHPDGGYLISRPVARGGGGGDHAVFRLPDGRLHTAALAAPVADDDPDRLRLAAGEALPVAADDAPDEQLTDTLLKVYRAGGTPLKVRIIGAEPTVDKVKLTAIDEVDAFYEALDLDLNEPLPARITHPPAITAINLIENLTLRGDVYVVKFVVDLSTSGDFRGAVIRAAYDDDPPAIVARADSSATAEWVGPAAGTMRLTITPGTDFAATGTPFELTYQILGKRWPPADVEGFLVSAQGDGTRQFNWLPVEDPDLAGYKIRYRRVAAGQAVTWEQMDAFHEGVLTANSYEINRPPSGHWNFAIKAIDSGGRESTQATFIQAELPDERLGSAVYFECLSSSGYPGTLNLLSPTAADPFIVQAVLEYSWGDLSQTAWDDWRRWWGGVFADGEVSAINTPAGVPTYTAEVIDLGQVIACSIKSVVESNVAVDAEFRIANDAAALELAAWQPISGALIEAQLFQARWRLPGAATYSGGVAEITNICLYLLSPHASEQRINDQNTKLWPRGRSGGRLVPTNLNRVTSISVILQQVGAGWSSSIVSKAPPEIAIFNGAGEVDDAIVDVVLGGF